MGYDKEEKNFEKETPDVTAFVVPETENGIKKVNTLSNIVSADTLHRIQSAILDDLAKILANSFGPHGSNTCIKKLNALNQYTKDGHTILESVQYNGIIEQSIKDDIATITLNIAKTVGDGTTSAVLMSDYIFKAILEAMKRDPSINAADITRAMDNIGKKMDEKIRSSAKEPDLQDIYDIAYTSSNGDPWVAQLLYSIYTTNGMDTFVDVAATTASDVSVKMYDGMTIDSGFMDSCFITDTEKNAAVVDNPEVYFFDDPIDTKEMGVLLDSILSNNIMKPIQQKNFSAMVPTVIVCPKISRDMSSFMDVLINLQNNQPAGNKLPVNFVLNRTQPDQLRDIATLCGAKNIYKYIDAKIYEDDLEKGLAPTPENIYQWAGHCETVESSSTTTKFVHPALMRDEDGNYTTVYNNILSFVESEIKKNEADGGDIHQVGTLKRRLHALKSNLVEIKVGGMTVADRDAMLHLIEDSVKNCRSAAANGVGWGANVSGMFAIEDVVKENVTADDMSFTPAECIVVDAIYGAYYQILKTLYMTCMSDDEAERAIENTLVRKTPLNLRNKKFDGTVKSSIESDTIILNSVMKIVGIMVTCNQFSVPSAAHNVYEFPKEI